MLPEEKAEAIAQGIAYGEMLLERLKKYDDAPREDSIERLDAFENELSAVQSNKVWSNRAVSDDDLAVLREIRAMVADWNTENGARPEGLTEKVDTLLARGRARNPGT